LANILSPSVEEDDSIGDIPVVTDAISNESIASAPLYEESHLQQFEASADLHDSVINDTENASMNSTAERAVIPSHESAAERNDITELTGMEGAPTNINTRIHAAIPTAIGESIIADLALTFDESETRLPLSNEDTLSR
jgi:hypothetical protein